MPLDPPVSPPAPPDAAPDAVRPARLPPETGRADEPAAEAAAPADSAQEGAALAAMFGVSETELLRIARVMTRLRVLIGRRVIGRVAISRVTPGAELSVLDVMSHVPPRPEGDADGPGVTVGAVARAMRLDPSRASRLVSEMVEKGLLCRGVSPSDARASLVMRTALGQRLHTEIQQVKRRLIADVLEGWTPEEVETFATLFERFIGLWESRIDEIAQED